VTVYGEEAGTCVGPSLRPREFAMRLDYDYVIVGGGVAADSAARAIREADAEGSIAILSDDVDEPYDRPPLSKDLWHEDAPSPDSTYFDTASVARADVRTSTRVTAIRPETHIVEANDDDEYAYGVLLLATGGRPRELNLPPGPEVVYFRSLGDYHRARTLADDARCASEAGGDARIVVVGGGFIGTELAAGIATAGAPVTYLTSDAAIGARVYPEAVTRTIAAKYAEHDVEVVTDARVQSLEQDGSGPVTVHVQVDGTPATVTGPGVVVGFGIEPNVELAVAAGLNAGTDGVVVDSTLRTSDPDIFAAGDVAMFPDPLLGTRRVEHVDHAQSSGTAAGKNLVARRRGVEGTAYDHTPFFYSDIFDLGYEAVGVLDVGLDMVEDWAEGAEGDTGVVYYVGTEPSGEQGALKGVLLWNVWDSVDKARELMAEFREPGSVTSPVALKGRIPTT
jgi:NADPH-dependent 2,4-dienoyl-CoA reductase/sulfur reductase-like enzyme